MSTDDLPSEFFVPSRDEIALQYQRDYKFHQPTAVVGAGTAAAARGNALADTLLPLYADAKAVAQDAKLADMTEAGLNKEATAIGIATRLPPSAATGYVTITASTGGGTIQAGDELRDPKTQIRARVLRTDLYTQGSSCAIETIDTGPTANLAEGTRMTWVTQRPGIGSTATVAGQNGAGLEGGRDQETLDEMRARIADAKANPASAGNDAEIRKVVRETPNVPVQEVFTYACSDGPGTTAYAFTLRPATAGGSRAPSSAQVGLTLANVIGELPKDDGIIACLTVEEPTYTELAVRWVADAPGWADISPWPSSVTLVLSAGLTDAYNFSVSTEPKVGATFALYNPDTGKFSRKKVLSYSPVMGGYAVVCDQTNGASDAYLPVALQAVSPWSDSLDLLLPPLVGVYDGVGPGEMVASFFDEGMRQKRNPATNPRRYPHTLTGKSFDPVEDIPDVDELQVNSPTLPYVTPVGTLNVSVNLLTLGDIAVYPL
jgi:hypothetical protein